MRKLLIILLTLTVVYGQDKVAQKFGKGLVNVVGKDSTFSVKFGVRAQSLFVGEWAYDEASNSFDPGTTKFLIRRARLKFGGFAFSPKLTYKFEFGLSNRDISGASVHTKGAPRLILDAVVKWNFYKNFSIWAGQTKLPGNRERVISSANLQLVDRSMVNSLFNIDRDMGMQLRHHFKIGKNFIIREAFAVSQGEGRNVVVDNLGGYQYTGRLEFLPFGKFASKGDYIGSDLKRELKPKLAIGVTYDFNDRAVKTRSNMGSYMATDYGYFQANINTFFADAMFKYRGFSVMAEFAHRTSNKSLAFNGDGTATGAYVQTGYGYSVQSGYLFKNNWELTGRYTTVDMFNGSEGETDLETQYTLGVSKYIVGHKLKVQTDVSYLSVNNTLNGELMYRLQIDIHL